VALQRTVVRRAVLWVASEQGIVVAAGLGYLLLQAPADMMDEVAVEVLFATLVATLPPDLAGDLAAATSTLSAAELIGESTEQSDVIRVDSLQIIDAVNAGVTFLGTGAIIRGGQDAERLTTGASLWISSVIGVACGGGYYVIAIVATSLAVIVLYVVSFVENHFGKPKSD
jgi:putative Mg2+ transporter-C (MgtC) family protein